jgi:ribokinase
MEVIGIGALNVDKLFFVERIAGAGDEVPVNRWVRAPGGSAANTIIGLARLGVKTGFIGNVGYDDDGTYLLNDMEKENVDTGGIKRIKGSTGIILGFVDKKGERALYAYPGVNNTVEISPDILEYAKKAKMLHLSSFVGERAYEAQRRLLKELSDIEISFAPGALYVRKKIKALELMIRKSSVIFLNKSEVEILTGKEYKKGVYELLKKGAGIVAVTLGEAGCYIADNRENHRINAYKTQVVDTTGAGDAFAAGFLYGYLRGKTLIECGKLGNWVASRCISRVGARSGLPYASDLDSANL